MSYQALWRRYLSRIEDLATPKLLSLYKKKMGRRLDTKDPNHITIVTEEVFSDPALTSDVRVLAARVNKKNSIDFRRVAGINLHADAGTEAAIDAFRERNVALFKTLANEELESMSDILDEAERGAWTVSTLSDRLAEEFEVTQSKADFWARDQVLKLNGQLTQLRQTNAGISKYIWTTSGDERVRETHAELDGSVQSWADPPVVNDDGDTANPGDDYQCRCTAYPVLDELDGDDED